MTRKKVHHPIREALTAAVSGHAAARAGFTRRMRWRGRALLAVAWARIATVSLCPLAIRAGDAVVRAL